MKRIYTFIICMILVGSGFSQDTYEIPQLEFKSIKKSAPFTNQKAISDTLGYNEFRSGGASLLFKDAEGYVVGTTYLSNAPFSDGAMVKYINSGVNSYVINEVLVWIGAYDYALSGGTSLVTAKVSLMDGVQSSGGYSGPIPSTLLGSGSILLNTIDTSIAGAAGFVSISLSSPVAISPTDGDWAVEIDLSDCTTKGDTVGIMVSNDNPVLSYTEPLSNLKKITGMGPTYKWEYYYSFYPTWKHNVPAIFAVIETGSGSSCITYSVIDGSIVNGTYTSPSGKTLTTPNIYYDTIPNAASCDSIIRINLSPCASTYSVIDTTISTGSYTGPSGKVYTAANTYYDIIPNSNGCDSVITINLTTCNTYSTVSAKASAGAYTSPSGKVFTTPNIYYDTIPNTVGCDSIITINLTGPTVTDTLGLDEFMSAGTPYLQQTISEGYDVGTGYSSGAPFSDGAAVIYKNSGADYFVVNEVVVWVGAYNYAGSVTGNSIVTAKVSLMDGTQATSEYSGSVPGTLLGSGNILLNTIDTSVTGANGFISIPLSSPITISPTDGDWAVEIDLSDCTTKGDTVGIMVSADNPTLSYTGSPNSFMKITNFGPTYKWELFNTFYSSSTWGSRVPAIFAVYEADSATACITYSKVNASTCAGAYTSPSGKTFTAPNTYYDTIPNVAGCDSIITIHLSGPTSISNFELEANLVATTFRPGTSTNLWLDVVNNGCVPSSGQLSLVLDSFVTYDSASIAPSLIVGDTLIWNFDTLSIDSANFRPLVFLNTKITAFFGDTICLDVIVTPTVGDADISNNTRQYCYPVISSYDPNDKQVYPKGKCDANYILNNQLLTYTIRFQNTGNAAAFDVFILDSLDLDLDISTVRVVGKSHEDLVTTILPGNVVEFRFDDIMLPDSNSNEPGSHGYVIYEVMPFSNQPNGTLIENTAGIYFDYNPPVITNTVSNTIIDVIPVCNINPTGTIENKFKDNNISIYPNPTTGKISIEFGDNYSDVDIKIINITGTVVYSNEMVGKTNLIELDLKQPAGMYFISISSKESRKVFKLIKR